MLWAAAELMAVVERCEVWVLCPRDGLCSVCRGKVSHLGM